MTIAIVGGGICGLTLALNLKARNIPCRVYESAPEVRELKQANAQLQRELKRKDKALAEAAALLVLSKKYQALFGDEDE